MKAPEWRHWRWLWTGNCMLRKLLALLFWLKTCVNIIFISSIGFQYNMNMIASARSLLVFGDFFVISKRITFSNDLILFSWREKPIFTESSVSLWVSAKVNFVRFLIFSMSLDNSNRVNVYFDEHFAWSMISLNIWSIKFNWSCLQRVYDGYLCKFYHIWKTES